MPVTNINKKSRFIFYILATVFFVVIFSRLRLMDHADDVVFSHALDSKGIIDYLYQRYFLWSGRVFIEAIMVSTIKYHMLWKVFIPASVILMSYLMWSAFMRDAVEKYSAMSISLILILCIDGGVAGDAQWWVTGFYNYLMPMVCGLFVIDRAINAVKFKKITIVTIAISGLIATSCEQIAISMIIVCISLTVKDIINKRKITPIAMITLLIFFGSAINLLSPGSQSRFYTEAARYMPQIIDMSIWQKSIIGVDRLVENISASKNILFLACCFVFISFKLSIQKTGIVEYMQILICSIALISVAIGYSAYMNGISILSYQGKFTISPFGDYHSYIYYTVFLLALMSMAIGTICDSNGKINLDAFISILSGTIVTVAIGLSPTAYASNERVLYVFNICMIIYILCIIRRLRINKEKENT